MATAKERQTTLGVRNVYEFGSRPFVLSSDFDSGHLGEVERYTERMGQEAFNIHTRKDNEGGTREGPCDSWFYFCIKGFHEGETFRINLVKFKQKRCLAQGWVPVFKTNHGPNRSWARLREKLNLTVGEGDAGNVLSFDFKVTSARQTTWFAFSYPYSYDMMQRQLLQYDRYFGTYSRHMCHHSESLGSEEADLTDSQPQSESDRREEEKTQQDRPFTPSMDRPQPPAMPTIPNDLYYHREVVIETEHGRTLDLITVSSFEGIVEETEARLPGLFPNEATQRPFKFPGKKVAFITARVHPGEAPSSHVFNGLLEFLLRPDDVRAKELRRRFVFKLIPMLNPDGVARGHFRADTRGVNLNRVYLQPHYYAHPTIYATRQLILYYHCIGYHLPNCPLSEMTEREIVSHFLEMKPTSSSAEPKAAEGQENGIGSLLETCDRLADPVMPKCQCEFPVPMAREHGLVLYVDLHAHANRQGCFIFGNYFEEPDKQAACQLLPKVLSFNSPFFEVGQCLFTKDNMTNKEGTGRVAMYNATGMVHCYTLECHYASGKSAGSVRPISLGDGRMSPVMKTHISSLYEVRHFEQVGRALAVTCLDMVGSNPLSRLSTAVPPTTLSKISLQLQERIIMIRSPGMKRRRKAPHFKYVRPVPKPKAAAAASLERAEEMEEAGPESAEDILERAVQNSTHAPSPLPAVKKTSSATGGKGTTGSKAAAVGKTATGAGLKPVFVRGVAGVTASTQRKLPAGKKAPALAVPVAKIGSVGPAPQQASVLPGMKAKPTPLTGPRSTSSASRPISKLSLASKSATGLSINGTKEGKGILKRRMPTKSSISPLINDPFPTLGKFELRDTYH